MGVAPDVALAVSEAITNAVVHAYRDESAGPVRVVACAEPRRLVVVVRDHGCGMSPNPGSPGLGLGLSVIGRLAAELNIERPDAGGGTRLRCASPTRDPTRGAMALGTAPEGLDAQAVYSD